MLNKSFDKLRTNGKWLIPFVVSPSAQLRTGLSNAILSAVEGHERNQLVQCFLRAGTGRTSFLVADTRPAGLNDPNRSNPVA